ncbi:MAG: hypothetical protein ACOVPA_16090 [Rubrivivax sp.]
MKKPKSHYRQRQLQKLPLRLSRLRPVSLRQQMRLRKTLRHRRI